MGIVIGGNTLSGHLDPYGSIQNTPSVITDGLILWWDAGNYASYQNSGYYFDCGYGCQYYTSNPGSCIVCNTQLRDMSGNAIQGTLYNTSLSTSTVGAFSFTVGNNGVIADYSSLLTTLKTSNGGVGLTVLVWAKSNGGTGSWRKLIGNGDGDNYIDLYQNPSGYWHQDGSGESLFVDGVAVGNDTYYMPGAGWHQWGATNVNSGSTATPSNRLTVGNEPNLSSYPWYGEIAIVQVYNRVLTTTEMLQNYNNQRLRFGV